VTTKAERSRGMPRRSIETQAPPSRLPLIIGGALSWCWIVAAVAAVAMSAGPSGSVAEPASRPVGVTGDGPSRLHRPGERPGGRPAGPQLSGTGFDGEPVSFGPGDGPMAIVVLAHWCAYCQAEVPPLVSRTSTPADCPRASSSWPSTTSIDPARPNYPPSRLARERGLVGADPDRRRVEPRAAGPWPVLVSRGSSSSMPTVAWPIATLARWGPRTSTRS
jgi:hypothetical protein